jgi:hypothetical protein
MKKKRHIITIAKAKMLAKQFDIDTTVVPLADWHFGLNIEMEHGKVHAKTNVTHDDATLTAKIALAHLFEYPDYYKRLRKMEAQAEKYWSKRTKKSPISSLGS